MLYDVNNTGIMKNTFLNSAIWTFLLTFLLVGCASNESRQFADNEAIGSFEKLGGNALDTNRNLSESEEETTISMPIQGHGIQILRNKGENKEAKLSDANVKELESWWDSLPKPVQSQIKANKIDIEVVSSIRTSNKENINTQLNDSQIENTGETLVQIIGTKTEMTYTVNTTLIGNVSNQDTNEVEHTTNIRLVKQVPVKLQQFNTDIFLREKQVSNDNIRTLQYWWTNLPEDIQNKIKNRELILDVVCHTVTEMDNPSNSELTAAEEHVGVMADLLNRIVGVYKINKKEFPLAQVKTTTQVEKANAKNMKFPAKHYIKIGLHKNKAFIPNTL